MEWTGFLPLGLSDDTDRAPTQTYTSSTGDSTEIAKWIEKTKKCEALSEEVMLKLCKKVPIEIRLLTSR
jgi:hypothetical protein